ncbi:hypothetical protein IJI31_07585 [bacterium]|nr:hypothetical protein [bacterium]
MDINKLTLRLNAANYKNLKNEEKKEAEEKEVKPEEAKIGEKQVPADKVLNFMNVNAMALRPVKESKNDAECEARIAASMDKFEKIFAIAKAEFGDDIALAILDEMCE